MSFNIEELETYAKQIDYHIRSLVDLTDVMREIKSSLDEIRKTKEEMYMFGQEKIATEMSSLTKQLEKIGLPKIDSYTMQMNAIKDKLEEDWPEAIDPDFIYVDDKLKAENIVDMIIMDNLEGMKFLDYGCNTGHVVIEASNRNTSMAAGFDVEQKWEFPSVSDNSFFTSNFSEIIDAGPFDVVLLYDVLDHADDPEEVLERISSVLSPKGRIYVRCHPWCSKHGAHLHEQINKAYLHLILDKTELTRLGYEPKKTNKIFHPIQTYRKWFDNANLEIQQELPIESEPSHFFWQDAVLHDRLQKNWTDNMRPYISIEFIDYVLSAKDVSQKVF